jgi:ABC-type nitrate/sulfonate/bicarbonate transport system substrate-binding protein
MQCFDQSGLRGQAVTPVISRRRSLQLLAGAFPPLLLTQRLAHGCDDPPKHYPDPCKGAFVQSSAYLAVADAKGLFKQHGIALTLVPLTMSDWREVAKAVADAGVAHIFGSFAIRSLLADTSLIVIAAPRNQINFALWSRVNMKTPEDLSGLKIGLGLPGAGTLLAWETMTNDPTFVPVKSRIQTVQLRDRDRFPAVERGAVEGGLFPVASESRLKAAGLHKIRQTGAVPFADHVLVTTERILGDAKNRRFLVSYVKSIVSASHFLDANPAETVDILAKYWKLRKDAAEDLYVQYQGSSRVPVPTSLGLHNVIRELQIAFPDEKDKLARIRVDRIFTEDIVRAVQSSSSSQLPPQRVTRVSS